MGKLLEGIANEKMVPVELQEEIRLELHEQAGVKVKQTWFSMPQATGITRDLLTHMSSYVYMGAAHCSVKVHSLGFQQLGKFPHRSFAP